MYGFNNNDGPVIVQKKKNNSSKIVIIVIISLIIFSLLLTLAGMAVYRYAHEENQKKIEELNLQIEALKNSVNSITDEELSKFGNSMLSNITINTDTNNAVVVISQKAKPSVVGIRCTVPPTTTQNGFFEYQTEKKVSEGSGIIISADGYIATNRHVIEYSETYENTVIEVILTDGNSYEAKRIGSDSQNDLAVVKIEAQGLPVAEIGNSDELNVGELAVAIGNPLGLEFAGSVTVGYISALDRNLRGCLLYTSRCV